MYEGGIRVPFMMQWKGKLPAGKTYAKPVISLDIFATALALAGVPSSRAGNIDGTNLLPYVTGEDPGPPHNVLFWRQGNRTALRLGDWKLLRHGRKGPKSSWELYDLAHDQSERHDLASRSPEKLRELQQVWERWDSQMVQPAW